MQNKKRFFQRKKETKKLEKKSPTISRFIPVSFNGVFGVLRKGSKILVIGILGFILVASIGRVVVKTYADYQKQQEVISQRQQLLQDVKHWEGVVRKYKGYRDGYFQLAVLQYQLGDSGKATIYLQKTLELDPNFESGRKLEQQLNK